MKVLILVLLVAVSFSAQAKPLKSKSLRTLVCEQVINAVSYDLEVLLNGVEKDCVASKKSFEVVNSVFSKDFDKVISLTVDVDYKSKTGLIFQGSIVLKRNPSFDDETGVLKLGKWQTSKNDIDYKLTKEVIRPLLEEIAENDSLRRAEVYISDYDPKKFNFVTEEAKLQSDADEFNSESKKNYIEYELEDGEEFSEEDADYCKMELYEGHENISTHGESYAVNELMEMFKAEGFIKASFSLDNYGGESEYCSQYTTVVYFIDGTRVEMFFDFNT